MTLSEYRTARVTWHASAAETRRFGLVTHRIVVGLDTDVDGKAAKITSQAIGDCVRAGAELVIMRFHSASAALIGQLDLSGWSVYPAGALLYWEVPVSRRGLFHSAVTEVDGANREAMSAVIGRVINDSFDGYVNHYTANPLIPNDAIIEGYLEWATTIARDPRNPVLIVTDGDDDEVAGVAVLAASGGDWEVDLASVRASFRRRGLYSILMNHAIAAADREGRRLIISTQSHNIAVQRAWAKLGLLPIDSIETVHLVRRTARS